MTSTLAQTPLYDWHASHGGRMVDFAGWSMPVQYASIVAEHNATRSAVGLFDVSHMGRIRFEGPESELFLDRIVTRRVAGMKPGQIRYALVTHDAGGILDDARGGARRHRCRVGCGDLQTHRATIAQPPLFRVAGIATPSFMVLSANIG